MQQMLWSECIIECLQDGGEVELAKRLTSTGTEIAKRFTMSGIAPGDEALTADFTPPSGFVSDSGTAAGPNINTNPGTNSGTNPGTNSGTSADLGTGAVHRPTQAAGCREVARVGCSKCGKTSLDSARFCKSCGQRLIQDVQYKPPKKVFTQAPLVVTTLVFFLATCGLLATQAPAKPQFLPTHLSYLPDVPWIRVSTYGVNKLAHEPPKWRPIPDGAALNENVQVYFYVRANQDCYMYMLSDLPKSKTMNAAIEFPEPKTPEKMLKKGDHFTVPSETVKEATYKGVKGLILNGLTTGAGDTTILIASKQPLPLPGNQENLNMFFENANRILSLDRFAGGIEVPISQVAPNLFPPDVNDKPGDLIYLKRLMEKIPTD
ncbi:MAG: zinc ribbon domain-containing protein [Cyanobacteria bacterium SZAS-4]|nr:zinc ribbon domain-containing protein [Cyanobacteria bacterium SZAS-4]